MFDLCLPFKLPKKSVTDANLQNVYSQELPTTISTMEDAEAGEGLKHSIP